MRFDGAWLLCDDGVARPVLRCEVLAADRSWRAAEFFIDSGADRTVVSANVLKSLCFEAVPSTAGIGGVGGTAEIHVVMDWCALLARRED